MKNLFRCFRPDDGGRGTKTVSGKITSFETVTLHTSGMRYTKDYEIVMKDGQAEITEYEFRYTKPEHTRIPVRQVLCGESTALKLLNDCKIMSWDGFYGSHPKGVLDGIMFSFKAKVNGDKEIEASGSQNFPRHYRDFTDGLYKLLNEENQ